MNVIPCLKPEACLGVLVMVWCQGTGEAAAWDSENPAPSTAWGCRGQFRGCCVSVREIPCVPLVLSVDSPIVWWFSADFVPFFPRKWFIRGCTCQLAIRQLMQALLIPNVSIAVPSDLQGLSLSQDDLLVQVTPVCLLNTHCFLYNCMFNFFTFQRLG